MNRHACYAKAVLSLCSPYFLYPLYAFLSHDSSLFGTLFRNLFLGFYKPFDRLPAVFKHHVAYMPEANMLVRIGKLIDGHL